MVKIADKMISMLESAGVERIYGIIGDSLNEIGRAVSESKISWISVRHEEIGVFAAGGEAFLSKKLCVCAGTSGPGSIHLINGLYEANANSVPVLAIVTHIPSSEVGFDYFQSTHPLRAFADCSVFCETLSSPSQMPRLLHVAMQTAVSKQGVAVIIVSGDITSLPYEDKGIEYSVNYALPTIMPSKYSITSVASIINSATKVCLYCGYGCRDCFDKVLLLAERLQAPIVWTLRSKFFAEADNLYGVGMNGHLGTGSAVKALFECDCLLLLGTDFPFSGAIPKTPEIIQIDSCGEHLGRRSKLNGSIIGDVGASLDILLPLLKEKLDYKFLNMCLKHAKDTKTKLCNNLTKVSAEPILRPEYLTKVISYIANDDAIFIVDVGLNDVWASRYLQGKKGRIIFGSFRHGTMGAGLGQAIGMSLLDPRRQIIYLAGDGNLTMFLGDLLTIKKYNLPIKIVVYNNRTLGFIDLEAKMVNLKPFATELNNPSFAKLGDAMGIYSFEILDNINLPHKLFAAFSQDRCVLIDAVTNPTAIGLL